ncbi:MAG: hypothetical protein CMI08_02720 [Oceanospirillaceae bacterium]|uniref:hypothetical protein n=1 Tax=unclassified Thalassolituus TaxID=2624967 RepID=UPI000C600382|nr:MULTISPECIES: hypothetical protein [unclassified Thalassolituus]MAS24358.1 hypothetical protein [Oceanospirillaceae bacterium]MAX98112.1 hypothetical protein [Oceanospirillaceae bacterium]MBL34238.1 hypothetical protein [Oceanospirillaceae bacterium]MBS52810.1 hypothetical protein [Oceanospirillaceae bacterium]|tara:strand:+ start:68 stop:490 length:423 start_codon:yes stop_codon:yes gene_type:complete
MKKLLMYLLMLTPATPAISFADDGLMVIANTGGKEITLTREQVRNLFMGASLGYDFNPVALPPRNHVRSLFNAQVIGLTESRIQSYWSQMKFTGRMKPPKELNNPEAILEFISQNRGSVGYVPAGVEIPASLTVVYATDM